MTYKQTFDHLGHLQIKQTRKRHRLGMLARWLITTAVLIAWAILTFWMDGK